MYINIYTYLLARLQEDTMIYAICYWFRVKIEGRKKKLSENNGVRPAVLGSWAQGVAEESDPGRRRLSRLGGNQDL